MTCEFNVRAKEDQLVREAVDGRELRQQAPEPSGSHGVGWDHTLDATRWLQWLVKG